MINDLCDENPNWIATFKVSRSQSTHMDETRSNHQNSAKNTIAKPFLKWAGGKTNLLPELLKRIPDQINTYWEPFVGGGAMFFAISDRVEQAIISDINEELISTYEVVRDNVIGLIDELQGHQQNHCRDYYYQIRNERFSANQKIKRAARLIYLNKTCYNGLYRVNSKGEFNVPMGSYKNPKILDQENLIHSSNALQNVSLFCGNFGEIVKPSHNDFIYCDPPYDETFTDYDRSGFDENSQNNLRDAVMNWTCCNANVMVSNSNTALINQIYFSQGGGKS